MTGQALLTYWYFHLPNFVLAALMYTLLGRALLGLIVQPDSSNYIWRFFCLITDPVVAAVALVTPKAARAGGGLAVRRGLAVLAAGRALVRVPVPRARAPPHLSRRMERHWYYIGIAFFGTINGLFNQDWVLIALIPMNILAPALLFGSVPLTLMFSSLMVSTATVILGGIPAAIYERVVGAKDDSTEASLWIWLAGTGLLTLPAMGNFFRIGL